MNRYEVLLIRFGLLYLVLTAVFGVLFMLQPQLAAYFRVTHVHLGFLGFFLSLVMGVAYWMMPRPGGMRQERATAATFYLHNAGLVLRSIGEPWFRYAGGLAPQAVTAAGGVASLAAIVIFAVAMFRRVRTAEEIQNLRRSARLEREAAEKINQRM